MSYLVVGMSAPNKIKVTLDRKTESAENLTQYNYCRFYVRKPGATSDVTWDGTITTSAAAQLVVEYELQAGDLNAVGEYVLKPRLSPTIFGSPPQSIRYCSNIDVIVESS